MVQTPTYSLKEVVLMVYNLDLEGVEILAKLIVEENHLYTPVENRAIVGVIGDQYRRLTVSTKKKKT